MNLLHDKRLTDSNVFLKIIPFIQKGENNAEKLVGVYHSYD